jgi:hypothetical protein
MSFSGWNIVTKWLALLHVYEVPDTNLSPKTGYSEFVFHGFPQSLQANAGVVP